MQKFETLRSLEGETVVDGYGQWATITRVFSECDVEVEVKGLRSRWHPYKLFLTNGGQRLADVFQTIE